ncbi:sensor histidine kinase [Leptospira congkakensis]|uniref:histidine kinase n=1 Tax=Leptospira congkakensis TaxID=2484932 RepID=A0A4Z1A6B4_9LEPT|nr:HAMP domain-containing sensor histidine kinase [Leptospira congkakensis]TGL90204.1 sensor histidine kinase [Leptospira congkakensis]TGL91210.1 sensor histidine kinase [Leptospira congkakensis]TGL98262.1 sensor histidine kinase [Leptospira congkakensis]
MFSSKNSLPTTFVLFANGLPHSVLVFESPSSELSLESNLIYANPMARSIFDQKINQKNTQSLLDLFPTFQSDGFFSEIVHSLEGGKPSRILINHSELFPKDKSIKKIYSLRTSILTSNQFSFLLEDITETVEAMENTDKMLHFTGIQNSRLQNFAYIISHNVRQHSANFKSLIGLLEENPTDEEKKSIMEMLHTSADKLNETIIHLNDIVSIGQMLNKPVEVCDLEKEIQKTLNILKGSIESRNIQIIIDLEKNLKLKIIPVYLESILLNLISNAVKYVRLKTGASLKITAKKTENQVVLSFEDNGLGINLEKHGAKIFGMFKTFHKNEDARGIGLFITKSQVEVLGGTITVESLEGKGSTFTVLLPDIPEDSLYI